MIEIHAQRDLCQNQVQLAVFDSSTYDRHDRGLGSLVFTKVEPGMLIRPTVGLEEAAATRLMDELWSAGVRPTQQGTVGQLAAVNHHLADMRKLVAATLKVTL